jgi:hypothetical protein
MPRRPRQRRNPDAAPDWIAKIIQWLGIATTLIGALTALLLAVGKFGDAIYAPCKSFPSLPWCSTGAAIVLAPLDAGPVDGGHNQGEYCEPRAAAYRSQHPNYTITWRGSETNSTDFMRHTTYRYHCEFIATPNGRSLGLWLAIAGFAFGVFALLFFWWRRVGFEPNTS